MSEVKCEEVFGDQSVFPVKNKEYVVAVKATYDDESSEIMFDTEYGITLRSNERIIAIRRIIKVPTWTKADQLAGKLPEVGAKFFEGGYGDDEVIKIIDSAVVALRPGNRGAVSISKSLFFLDDGSIKPIETPAEKAQRLEDEWVNKAWGETAVFAGVTQDEHDRLRIHLRHIYKAQLSGQLKAPEVE